MIRRSGHLQRLRALLSRYPVVAILGARQVGKTTLARHLMTGRTGPATAFDLEDPRAIARLGEPMLALSELRGLVVLDEVQRRPDLFPVLRVLADRPRHPARFLVLGSASPDLLQQASESLAGRIVYYELGGLDMEEVGAGQMSRLWLRGGFPRSYLARSANASAEWRRGFARSFLERDIPQLGIQVPATTLRRFWSMLAHHQGQLWNSSEFARAFGVADTTVRRYVDLLSSTFMIRQLQAWHENLAKRQVKAPKIYFSDTGLLHALLGLDSMEELENHPRVGASWEGFALGQVVQHLKARPEQCFFWRAHTGAELDLLVIHGGKRLGFEFKRSDAPSVTPSMRSALEDLRLDRMYVIHAGDTTFALGAKIQAMALERMLEDLAPLR